MEAHNNHQSKLINIYKLNPYLYYEKNYISVVYTLKID